MKIYHYLLICFLSFSLLACNYSQLESLSSENESSEILTTYASFVYGVRFEEGSYALHGEYKEMPYWDVEGGRPEYYFLQTPGPMAIRMTLSSNYPITIPTTEFYYKMWHYDRGAKLPIVFYEDTGNGPGAELSYINIAAGKHLSVYGYCANIFLTIDGGSLASPEGETYFFGFYHNEDQILKDELSIKYSTSQGWHRTR